MTKASRFYWTQNINGNWSAWNLIGGSSVSLKTDAAVAYNSFSKVKYIFEGSGGGIVLCQVKSLNGSAIIFIRTQTVSQT